VSERDTTLTGHSPLVAAPVRARGASGRAAGMRRRVVAVVAPVVFGALLLGAWELLVKVQDLPPYILPAPSAIAEQLRLNRSDLWATFRASGANAVVGLAAGAILGVLAGMVAARARLVDELVSPLAAAVSAMPIVALAPVLDTMFSATSSLPRRIVVAVVAFFPVFVNTVRGLRAVDPVHAELMRSYAASGWDLTRVVRWPGSLPFVFTGLRVASSLAVIAAVVVEYFGGLQDGLGSRITSAASNTAYARAWAYVVAAIALGLLFYLVALGAERLATRGRTAPDR
jgi:NitT/TauT family transport system permease protein